MTDIPFALLPCGDTHHQTGEPFNIEISGLITTQTDAIYIQYLVTGDISKAKFPPVLQHGQRKNNLWKSTCFELFISPDNHTEYWEYNFSPSHHWALYQFSGYRENQSDDLSITDLVITTQRTNDQQFELACKAPLPDPIKGHTIDIGVSAVIQDTEDNLYYYALIHCKETADFHNRKSFIISVDANKF